MLLDGLDHFRWRNLQRVGKFENHPNSGLVDPALDQADEVSFDSRRQRKLLL